MNLEVNGSEHSTGEKATVVTVLKEIEAPADRVAVMVNGEVIHRKSFNNHALADGDKIDVLILTAGG